MQNAALCLKIDKAKAIKLIILNLYDKSIIDETTYITDFPF